METSEPKIASLSLDLDNQWSYMKSSQISGWESFPSYLDVAVPRSIDFFADRGLKITYFIVGQDAALDQNAEAIGQIPAAGHEVANHSFSHEPWLHLYSKQELIEEFEKTEEAIEKATGDRPKGFRGPGFSLSQSVMEVLSERGYDYDCSTFPTYIGPLARAFYFLKSEKMSDAEREKRKKLFGSVSDGRRPLKAYLFEAGGRELVEIPVTTLPILKTPIHVSYLMYLASFSESAARSYWRTALRLCKLSGVEPSLLLHPLDFLGGDDVSELKFFPGMHQTYDEKKELVSWVIDRMAKDFSIVSMQEHANIARARG